MTKQAAEKQQEEQRQEQHMTARDDKNRRGNRQSIQKQNASCDTPRREEMLEGQSRNGMNYSGPPAAKSLETL